MRFGIFALFALAFVLPEAASAQFVGTGGSVGGAPFTVSVSPQYPRPSSVVTLSFLSDSLNLTNATLTVMVAGKNIYQGSVKPVPVTLGKTGGITTVSVKMSLGGTSYTQTLSIQPQDVMLVAEPISSAPPLYPGKPLVPLGGNVRVVALANLKSVGGKTLDPSTVSYSWLVDNTRLANSSGIGKEALIVASPLQYRARTVSVTVMSQDGILVGGASLSLEPSEPSVRIYENDPLLGIRYDHALSGSYSITGAESTLYAAPFSLPTTGGSPLIRWFLNGSPAQTGSSITVRPTGSGRGTASLSLVASGSGDTTTTASLSLTFGGTTGFNLFGL